MANKTIYYIISIALIVFVIWGSQHCKLTCAKKEGYGQDASIRWNAGGVAGTGMYGYDPVMQFAEQIAAMRVADYAAKQGTLKEGFCDPRPDFWAVNYYPRNYEYEYPSYPPNDMMYTQAQGPFSAPNQNVGPSCGVM